MSAETIHLQSQHKGFRVSVTGGAMEEAAIKGRPPALKEKVAAIHFEKGSATVERDSRDDGAYWKHAGWKDLGVKTRAEAVEAIKRLPGHGIDFTITDAVVEAGVRESVGAVTAK